MKAWVISIMPLLAASGAVVLDNCPAQADPSYTPGLQALLVDPRHCLKELPTGGTCNMPPTTTCEYGGGPGKCDGNGNCVSSVAEPVSYDLQKLCAASSPQKPSHDRRRSSRHRHHAAS